MLDVENLSVTAGNFKLTGVNLHVKDGTCCILLGKSGAGKTVFLETLAGRHRVTAGKILWNGKNIAQMPPENRHIALVYQDYALFPHLTVAQNIAFPLKVMGKSGCDRYKRTESLLETFSLTHLAGMYPVTLSGGERQRTALARALAAEPQLLLLDEPMSALDCVTKESVKTTLKQMHHTYRTTIIQVTHDFDEALYFADNFAVVRGGTVSDLWTKEKMVSMKREEVYALLNG